MINSAVLITRIDAQLPSRHQQLQALADAELVKQFQRNHDVDVFEILVRRYRDNVFALATSIMGRDGGSEAEDATQEVFIVVYRSLDSFRGESAFSSWLYRVARNQIYGFRRRPAHRIVAGSDDAIAAVHDTNSQADPVATLTDGDFRKQLLGIVEQLSEVQKVCVHLFYWQDQSIDEIAALLEIEVNTVKSHLRRARMKLAKILQGIDVEY